MIMRKLKFVFACLFLIMLALGSFAENATDYFVGKWKVTVMGTPNGDAAMTVNLERVDGKLKGDISSEGMPITKIDRIEEKDNSIRIYYSAQGYDIYINLDKKDDIHLAGTLMDMFDIKGERVVENK